MTVDLSNLKDLVNPIYYSLVTDKTKTLILYGGSSSGKSYFIAQKVVIAVLQGENVLVIRKVGNTLKDSVYPLVKSIIYAWGLQKLFKFNKTEKVFTCVNGYKVIQRGIDDPEKIKSITVDKGIITTIWIEEATELSHNDFKQITLRMRGKSTLPKQIIMSFNPISQNHWIKKELFDKPNDNVKVLKTTYKDNLKYLSVDDAERIEDMKLVDIVYYNIYALGNWGVLGNLVYNNWTVKNLGDIKDSFNAHYFGIDWGWVHPFVFVKTAIRESTIYILQEIYQSKLTNLQSSKLVKPIVSNSLVNCDSAEPKSITDYQNAGINATGVKKGQGSVNHGIKWIKQFNIVVDSKCTNTIRELGLYKYREDKNGVVYEEPVDVNNDCMDAMRYSFNDLMNNAIARTPKVNAGFFGL